MSSITGPGQQEDQRIQAPASYYPYDALSTTRNLALAAIPAMEQYAASPGWRTAELFAAAGYVEVQFAEDMCNGVPLATVTASGPQPGHGFSRGQLLGRALSDFDSASAHTTGNDSIASLVRVGRARALLDSGQFGPAAAVADSVPVGFVHQPPYDGVHQLNSTAQAFASSFVSVSNLEGSNGLDFIISHDPRVPISASGTATTGDTIYTYAPYSTLASPLTLASGVEARLIAAEALLSVHGGTGQAWLQALNALRTTGAYTVTPPSDTVYVAGDGGVGGLRLLADPGSDTARVSLLFRERAYWLFLTGHRQGDLRRLIRQYGRQPEQVFPSGQYRHGGSYGPATEFSTYGDQNDPLYSGCIDHNA